MIPTMTMDMAAGSAAISLRPIGSCPALRAGMPPGCELLWAGEDQRTLVDGYISATPDGLIVNRSNQDVTIEGFVLAPGECIGVEIKSIDPRINLMDAKAEHIGQVHVQMGLIRACTEYRPNVVVVIYIDASFFDDIEIFSHHVRP